MPPKEKKNISKAIKIIFGKIITRHQNTHVIIITYCKEEKKFN